MSNFAKIAVLLLLVAAGGGALYYFNQAGAAVAPAPIGKPDQPVVDTKQPDDVPAPVRADATVPAPTRVAVEVSGDNFADAAQGVTGRILMPTGHPAVGVPVLLVKNASNNPFETFLNNQEGKVPPPFASGVTGDDGTFRLGLTSTGNPVDLRVLSPAHPVVNRSSLRVRTEEWTDIGDVRLKPGAIVTGRVIDSRTKGGVANATVHMKADASTGSMVAVPGYERGTPTLTDASGNFQFVNGPRGGSVTLLAEAEGYASTTLAKTQIVADAPNNFVIEVERGHTITGVCVDQNGARIPGAKIIATGLSTKTPQTADVISDDDGNYVFPTLHEGPYRLVAKSRMFEDATIPMALTGDQVKIVMATRGAVKLKVLAANRRPIKSYTINLKRAWRENPENIGNVLGQKARSITPRDYPREYNNEFALIQGLPSGVYRFQITDRDHAKTLSPIFEIEVGADPIEVVAEMTLGATITGTVIDDQGAPVADAAVATDMNSGIAANIGLLDIFKDMMPEKHTVRTVRTDRQGRFTIPKLSFADYMLRVSHPDYCEGNAIDIKLQSEGQQVDVGVIQLQLGAIVSGMTTVGGAPVGQVEVRVSMPLSSMAAQSGDQDPRQPAQLPKGKVLFSGKAFSGADGSYTLLKRVPPGTYEVSASRNSQGSPFDKLMDIKHTKRELIVYPGQREIDLSFDLPAR